MKLAEKFGVPVFTFIDTPGAYPGVGAEERGQSEAIGRNLYAMAELRVPSSAPSSVKAARAARSRSRVGDAMLMLQYATYSVISPEGCASILWKSAEHAPEAAETLGITATRLEALGPRRPDRQRTAGWRPPRSRSDDAGDQKALQESWRQLRDKPIEQCWKRASASSWAMAGSRKSSPSRHTSIDLVAHVRERLKHVVRLEIACCWD